MLRRGRQNPFGQQWMESDLIWVFAITPRGNGRLISFPASMVQRSDLLHCSLIETTHSGLERRMRDSTVSTIEWLITLAAQMGYRAILLSFSMKITRVTFG